jgi:hypothetical protein
MTKATAAIVPINFFMAVSLLGNLVFTKTTGAIAAPTIFVS